VPVADYHACNTVSGLFVTTNACGVDSPDESYMDVGFTPLAAGATELETFDIEIQLEARGVPEPTALSLFLMGLVAAFFFRKSLVGKNRSTIGIS
jgi:hypothetical protein